MFVSWEGSKMPRSIEAIIDADGHVRLLEEVHLRGPHRAVVTILEDTAVDAVDETALLSERALALDWDRPEEDAAWAHLRQDR
jgi:hypothetical protein